MPITNLSPQIQPEEISSAMATDAEYQAADAAHLAASHPHLQYKLQGAAETFTSASKVTAISNSTIATAVNFFPVWAGLEVQAAGPSSDAFMLFHQPGQSGVHFGLNRDNLLGIGGWSFGSFAKIWHEKFGIPVWQSPSDRALKEKISPIPSGLDLILKCEPVSFYYNHIIKNNKSFFGNAFQREKIHYGFVANTFPLKDLVITRDDGYLGLDHLEIIPFLCKAIQEQQQQIMELREKLELVQNSKS